MSVRPGLKPENVIVTREGWMKVPDSGLAKLRVATAEDRETSLPTVAQPTEPGTPRHGGLRLAGGGVDTPWTHDRARHGISQESP
jgi:hypothetical protein